MYFLWNFRVFGVVVLPEEQSFLMCCFHAVIVLTVRHGAPSLCSRCATVFLSSRRCAHGASRCSYKITRNIPRRHRVAPASSGNSSRHCAHGVSRCSCKVTRPIGAACSRKFRQTRRNVDSHKQAFLRISEPNKPQRC